MRISSISNQNMYRSYQQMSSGKKINTAADDAAGLAIAQKLLSQSNSLNKATDNAATFQDMTKIADGALGSISDSLQRIRELGLQASNGLYTDSDKAAIQSEIDQLKQHISDTASQTQFNTKISWMVHRILGMQPSMQTEAAWKSICRCPLWRSLELQILMLQRISALTRLTMQLRW